MLYPFIIPIGIFFFPQGGSYRALLAYEKEVELLRKEKASRRLPDKVQ